MGDTEWYNDFLTSIGIDPSSTTTADFGNNYLTNDQLFAKITGADTDSSNPLGLITKLLSGTGTSGKAGQLAGVAGLYSLINALGGGLGQTGQGVYKGYTGGIPKYTATRQQYAVPTDGKPSTYKPSDTEIRDYALRPGINDAMVARGMNQFGVSPERMANIMQLPVDQVQSRYQAAMGPNMVARRPGSGGVNYFTDMKYTPTVVQAAPTGDVVPKNATQFLPEVKAAARGGMMSGGVSTLGGYSDGGRLLRGPGDGVSDSIPATIGNKQPARLADGEFVIPARIVSEIGNGSTEAGAKKLYAMMDRIQGARKKSIKNVAANTKADKYLPK